MTIGVKMMKQINKEDISTYIDTWSILQIKIEKIKLVN